MSHPLHIFNVLALKKSHRSGPNSHQDQVPSVLVSLSRPSSGIKTTLLPEPPLCKTRAIQKRCYRLW